MIEHDVKFYGTLAAAIKLMKIGNSKFDGKLKKKKNDTIIFNMGSATDCPSKRLGLCQLDNCRNCYAYMAELRFPKTLDYRRRQEAMWKTTSAFVLAMAIAQRSHNKKIKFVRFNESGDLWDQDCVTKLCDIARMLPDLTFFGYTARKDLDYEARPDNLRVNGSGWSRGKMNKFIAVPEASGNNPLCFSDCSVCNLCKIEAGLIIENELHGPAFNYRKRKKPAKK